MTTTNPTPNLPLLRKVVCWATVEAEKPRHESEWDQRDWRLHRGYVYRTCGTTYCFAGYTCEVSGITWDRDFSDGEASWWGTSSDGLNRPASVHARQLLGLTALEAVALFDSDNTIDKIRRCAEKIAARAGERL